MSGTTYNDRAFDDRFDDPAHWTPLTKRLEINRVNGEIREIDPKARTKEAKAVGAVDVDGIPEARVPADVDFGDSPSGTPPVVIEDGKLRSRDRHVGITMSRKYAAFAEKPKPTGVRAVVQPPAPSHPKRGRAVVRVDGAGEFMGERYPSLAAASRAVGLSRSSLLDAILLGTLCDGTKWRFVETTRKE